MATTILPTIEDPEISPVDALWALIQSQTKSVRKALIKRMLEESESSKSQKNLVKTSLTQAFEELRAGKAKHNARSLFKK